MSFHNVRFPVEIGQGSSGGPGFRTEITTLDSGQEARVSFWDQARHRYDVSYGIRSLEDLVEVQTFYRARMGATHSFRYRDPLDWHSNRTNPTHLGVPGSKDQPTNPTNGNGTVTAFQMVKTYVSGGSTHTRTITLPVSGTIQVWKAGTLQTEGTHYTINYSTGIITFNSAPSAGQLIEWSGEFDVKVRFDAKADDALSAAVDGWDIGQISSIPLVEVIDADLPNYDEYFYGGSKEKFMYGSFEVDTSAFLWILSANTSNLAAKLPDPANMPTGGFYFALVNSGATFSILVKDNLNNTIATLAPNTSTFIALALENAGAKTWYALGD